MAGNKRKLRGLPDHYITAGEWAEATGYSVRNAYRLMERGRLPYRKHLSAKSILVFDIDDPQYAITPEQHKEILRKRAEIIGAE